MTKKILCILVFAMLLSGSLVISAAAKVDTRVDVNTVSDRIDQYDLDKVDRQNLRSDAEVAQANSRRIPLGVTEAAAGTGLGEVVDNTWDDFQAYMHNGHYVGSGFDATADAVGDVGVEVHFVYDELSSIDTATEPNYYKSGYNFYNASAGVGSNWPAGQEAGCQLEAAHTHGGGRGVVISVLPDGRPAFANRTTMRSEHNGVDDSTTFLDNHVFYQQDKSSFNRCYWDSTVNSSHVDPSIYQIGWVSENDDTAGLSNTPVIETQIVGGDTVTHLLLYEGGYYVVAGYPNGIDFHTVSYFRKVGTATPGTWSAATVIDTNFWYGGGIAASPSNSDVAIAMTTISPLGRLQSNENDCDISYTVSTNGGLTWPGLTNLTNYPRNVASWTAGNEVALLYDSRGFLHIVWTAQPTPADPYRGGYHWPDFGADLFHWSDAIGGGTTSMIQYASYDLNPAACSYGGYNAGYLAWFNLTECDGNLYATYNLWHGRALELGIEDPTAYDDCALVINGIFSSNAEIYLNVSSSLDGLLWDAPRNLTKTYTPKCDSVGGENGPCGHEYKPGAERWALDPSGMGTLTWPTGAKIDPGLDAGLPAHPEGGWYYNALYCDDQHPDHWSVGSSDISYFNSMKWMRIACVNPVEAPQIDATPSSLYWPRWMRYNEDSSYTVTVENRGNVPLLVTSIATSAGTPWLSTSVGSMTVAAGASPDNQATFDIQISTAGFSSPQFLDGEVYLISNVEPTAPATVDTLPIVIHILVADTVQPIAYDTVATSMAWEAKSATASGENVSLAVGNHGAIGGSYPGLRDAPGTNMDFAVDGGEPGDRGQDSIYLYNGGMYVLRNDGGGNVRLSTSIFQVDHATDHDGAGDYTEHGFDPVPDAGNIGGGVFNDGTDNIYDSVFTGRFVNRDTSVAVERVFYAPRNMNTTYPNFVIMKSKIFTGTKGTQNNLSVGDVVDWDIPSDEQSTNVSAASVPADVVYMQGTVHPDSTFAWDNSQRFGAEAMMGWYWMSDYLTLTDSCISNTDYHGSFGCVQGFVDNDTIVAPDAIAQPWAQAWWDSLAFYDYNSGNTNDTDQAAFMAYMHDFTLPDSDTLVAWTAFATVKQGTLTDLENTIAAARQWYLDYLRKPVDAVCSPGCCTPPTVGDCDQSGIVDITDVQVLVDNQFLSLTPLSCEAEGDCDYSGVVDITDLQVLIDNQFLTLTPLPPCP